MQLGLCPDAGVLDAVVVLAHPDPEESHLAPVGAPAVAADPVALPGLGVPAPPHQAHLMVDLRQVVKLLGEDPSAVGKELVRDLEITSDGSPGVDPLHDVLSANDLSVLIVLIVLN